MSVQSDISGVVDGVFGSNTDTETKTTTAPAEGSNTWIIVTVVIVVLAVVGITFWYIKSKKSN